MAEPPPADFQGRKHNAQHAVSTAEAGAELAGIVANTLVASLSAAPTQADEPSQPAPHIELQARSNLLVNDEGWNLPPGNSLQHHHGAQRRRTDRLPGPDRDVSRQPHDLHGCGVAGRKRRGLPRGLPINSSISSSVHINKTGDVAFTAGDANKANTLFMYDAAAEVARQITTMPVVPTSYSLGGIDEEQNIGFLGSFAGSHASAAVIDGTGVFYA